MYKGSAVFMLDHTLKCFNATVDYLNEVVLLQNFTIGYILVYSISNNFDYYRLQFNIKLLKEGKDFIQE